MLQILMQHECCIDFSQEPVDLWRELGWLEKFYSDPDKYAFAFQLAVFDSQLDAVEVAMANYRASGDTRPLVLLVERTFWDQRLFWQLQVDLGRASADVMHDQVYCGLWSKWRRFMPEPSLVVLFQTSSIQVTMQRLQARGRSEEKTTPLALSESSSESEQGRNLLLSSMGGDAAIDSVGGLTATYQQLLADKHREWFAEPLARPPCEPASAPGVPCKHINVDAPYHVSDGSLAELALELAEAIRGVLH